MVWGKIRTEKKNLPTAQETSSTSLGPHFGSGVAVRRSEVVPVPTPRAVARGGGIGPGCGGGCGRVVVLMYILVYINIT